MRACGGVVNASGIVDRRSCDRHAIRALRPTANYGYRPNTQRAVSMMARGKTI